MVDIEGDTGRTECFFFSLSIWPFLTTGPSRILSRRDGSWSYRYTNSDLLKISDTTDLCSFIEKQQNSYVMKILKKSNESIAKRLLLNDNDSRKPGPQTTLLTSVLKTSNCTLAELVDMNERK